jgi:hypothetical protein
LRRKLMRKRLRPPFKPSEDIRKTNVGPLECGDHCVHHAPLPLPIIGLERCASIHVHRHAALANKHGTLAKRAITGLHEGADLRGEIVTCPPVPPMESLE